MIFPRPVAQAAVGLTGYTVAFGNEDDHNIGKVEVSIAAEVDNNVVTVTSTLGLRDWSGDWDDAYMGNVQFAVAAELSSTLPRGDLQITGIETNQAVQFFRAGQYLDQALPDNAIPLTARKATAFRVYVDWDASAGLPLNALTGQLVAQDASGSVTTLSPINPGGAITPRADAEINMAVADHTLNFYLPAPQCVGTKTISVQVWDMAAPDPKSAIYTRTIVFTPMAALEMYVVGINYTANGLNLPAPTQTDFTNSCFTSLRRVYPHGDIFQSGFTTISYDEDVNFTITDAGGCGDGMNDLRDRLDDLRGGSDEVYLAVLPPLSQIQTPGSNIGGCGGDWTAVVFVDQPQDTQHEVGHALGRRHAPCNPGQCTPMPANVDDGYPQYGAFKAGSIGVFGFSGETNPNGQAFDPAGTFDFMAYRGPDWVSAYTYLALAGSDHPTAGGTSSGGLAHPTTSVPVDTLFLALTIDRDRNVERRPSFHFEALPRSQRACHEFVVELLGADGTTLVCRPLQCNCEECAEHCWPKRFRSALPYPAGARRLVIREKDEKVYEESIPGPPKVKALAPKIVGDHVTLRWSATGPSGNKTNKLWYVVQWFDAEDEIWRGVAPRTQANELDVPLRFAAGEAFRLRVLATSGIATGCAEFEPVAAGTPAKPAITLAEQGEGKSEASLPPVVHALAVSTAGRHLELEAASWHVKGRHLAHGHALDLRQLPVGRHVVEACIDVPGHGTVHKTWTIERTARTFRLLAHSSAKWPRRTRSADKGGKPRKPQRKPRKRS